MNPNTTISVHTQDVITASNSGFRETSLQETSATQLTTYSDASPHIAAVVPFLSSDSIWEGSNTLPNQDLETVLSRSYQLGVYNWTTSAFGTHIIDNMDVVATLLQIPNIQEKVLYYKYFRCKAVNLTIRVNSTAFHYGALACSSTVNNTYNFHNVSGAGYNQFLNCRPVLIDATSQVAVDYSIPWVHPNQWTSCASPDPHIMTFKLSVASVLSMIGSAMQDAKITVFANFEDPQVAFPLADSVAIAQSRNMGVGEARNKSESNSIVSGARDFASTLFEVVSTAEQIAERITPLAAALADKPTSLRPADHVTTLPGSDMAYTSGLDNNFKLCADPEATTGFASGMLGDAVVSPSVYSMVRTPGYLDQASFTNSMAAGTQILTHTLSLTGMTNSTQADVYNPTPLSWYSYMFRFWRGSLKFKFHFVTSTMITARVRLVWIPPGFNPPVTIDANEAGDYVSDVIEVTGTTTYDITIPWINARMYKHVDLLQSNLNSYLSTGSADDFDSLGTLALYLVTPIVTIDSVITPTVRVLYWVSAGEDFQLNCFAGDLLTEQDSSYVFAPQPGLAFAQCSIFQDFDKTFRPIVPSVVTIEAGLASSESYSGLVDLGKRYGTTPWRPEQASSHLYREAFIWDWCILEPGATEMRYFQQWLTAGHANLRGSIRWKAFWPTTVADATMPYVSGAYGDITDMSMWTCCPTFLSPNSSTPFVEFTAVYNTYVPFIVRTDPFTEYNGLNCEAVLPPTSANVLEDVMTVAMSFGDDFAIGVYQSLPVIEYTAPPLGKGFTPKPGENRPLKIA